MEKYKDWLTTQDKTEISQETVLAFAVSLDDAGYAPTTIRTTVSMLKKKRESKFKVESSSLAETKMVARPNREVLQA